MSVRGNSIRWTALAGVAFTALTGGGTGVASGQASVVVARYNFDQRVQGGSFVDESGAGHTLRAEARRGGAVKATTSQAGAAVAFPNKCSGGRCPHAVLQAAHAADLNPGRGPIRFGASVRLSKRQTSSGQNVLQKGYSASGSQYKLQIDGAAGRPSCVMVDDAVRTIYLAQSTVGVADGGWHRIECRRAGTELSILIDDVPTGRATVPLGLSVTNTVPLSIGGKGGGLDNDQFHGALDEVWIAIG